VNFAGAVKNGALGNFQHGRELTPPGKRGIIRPNRDTLYSFAVFDFDAGPVTITWPDAGKRFSGMQVVNQDQYTRAVYYGNGSYTRSPGTWWGCKPKPPKIPSGHFGQHFWV
jgi:hypothetical protein